MLGSIGVPELLLILLIVIIIFGAGKLPQLGRGIGEGIKNFRTSLKGEPEDKDASAKGNGSKDR
jgi:sec-independent protein translocase protein TatA